MQTKDWWKSKTIWGGIIAVVTGTLSLVDANFGTHIMSSQIAAFLVTFAGALGIYGRANATTIIK